MMRYAFPSLRQCPRGAHLRRDRTLKIYSTAARGNRDATSYNGQVAIRSMLHLAAIIRRDGQAVDEQGSRTM